MTTTPTDADTLPDWAVSFATELVAEAPTRDALILAIAIEMEGQRDLGKRVGYRNGYRNGWHAPRDADYDDDINNAKEIE